MRLSRLVVVALVLLGGLGCPSGGGAKGRGDYWCAVAEGANHRTGRCSATQEGCRAHAALLNDPALQCAQTNTLLYELRWNGPYGAMEAWFVDAATCEREARTFYKTSAPCVPSPWEGRGQRAH
jgi:hypothetical protein